MSDHTFWLGIEGKGGADWIADECQGIDAEDIARLSSRLRQAVHEKAMRRRDRWDSIEYGPAEPDDPAADAVASALRVHGEEGG